MNLNYKQPQKLENNPGLLSATRPKGSVLDANFNKSKSELKTQLRQKKKMLFM